MVILLGKNCINDSNNRKITNYEDFIESFVLTQSANDAIRDSALAVKNIV